MSAPPVQKTEPRASGTAAGADKGGFFARFGKGKAPGEDRKGSWGTRLALLAVVLIWMVPTIGLIVTSFRGPLEANSSGWWTAFTGNGGLSADNYVDVLQASAGGSTLVEAFVNSVVVAVPATLIPILIAAFAAYAFSWMDFKGREPLFILFVALLVVPLQVAFIPIIQLQGIIDRALPLGDFTINGSFVAIWLAHAGFGMPLAVYLLRNFIGSLPKEVIESAKVDGAGHFATFWRLIIPLSVPALAAFAIFQFLWTWNDFLVALIMLDRTGNGQVATTYLAGLIGSFGEQRHLLTAGAFITMTVPLLVFFGLQRYFVRGLTAGSVKG
jgi:alpha-glucoside transport system permease protein